MPRHTAPPDPLVGALLEEVVGIRGELAVISRRLGEAPWPTPPSPSARPASSAPAPRNAPASSAAPTVPAAPPRAASPEAPTDWSAQTAPARSAASPTPAPMSRRSTHASDPWAAPSGSLRRGRRTPPDAAARGGGPLGATDASAPHAPLSAKAGPSASGPAELGTPARAAQRRAPSLTPERVLAVAGAIVTILGVGFLLAVAIAAGLFGPIARVSALAVLAVVLGLVSRRVRRTSEDAAVALAATSAAAAFGVAVAATTVYGWVPPPVGVLGALGLAGAGVFAGHRWRSAGLAGLVYLQALLVLAVIVPLDHAAGYTQLTVFAAVAYVPVVLAVVEHRWLRLFRWASVALGLVALLGVVWSLAAGGPGLAPVLAALAVLALVAAVAMAVGEVAILGSATAATAFSLLALRVHEGQGGGVRLDTILAGVLATLAAAAAVRYRGGMRGMLTVSAVTYLFLATTTLPVSWRAVAVLLAFEALALLLAARVRTSLALWGASLAFTVTALGCLLALVPLPALLATSTVGRTTQWEAVAVGALLAAVGALTFASRSGLRPARVPADVLGLAGIALGLYGATSGIVAVGLLDGASSLQEMGANVITTIVWVGVAVAMILRPASPLSRAGFVLMAAAIAKLFLADLHSVDGVLRAVLFVLTGLVLIGAASQIRRFGGATVPTAAPPTAEPAAAASAAPVVGTGDGSPATG